MPCDTVTITTQDVAQLSVNTVTATAELVDNVPTASVNFEINNTGDASGSTTVEIVRTNTSTGASDTDTVSVSVPANDFVSQTVEYTFPNLTQDTTFDFTVTIDNGSSGSDTANVPAPLEASATITNYRVNGGTSTNVGDRQAAVEWTVENGPVPADVEVNVTVDGMSVAAIGGPYNMTAGGSVTDQTTLEFTESQVPDDMDVTICATAEVVSTN